jgi:uncharacterized protein YmfQ (DUF2313 family)
VTHAELLALLLPPVSYDPTGTNLSAELSAEGNAIDQALLDAGRARSAIMPYGLPEMLADWERVYGLPDPCTDPPTTYADRLAAVLGKVRAVGGLTPAYFIGVAAALGYTVTITEEEPWTCESPCELPANEEDWWFVWTAHAPETTITEFTCETPCEEPLRSWGNARLECALKRLAPAHTIVHFAYGA